METRITVYRIEECDGERGPFRSYRFNEVMGDLAKKLLDHAENMPLPTFDGEPFAGHWSFCKSYVFGVLYREDLERWFPCLNEILEARDSDNNPFFKIKEFLVPEHAIVLGNTQVAFLRSLAE